MLETLDSWLGFPLLGTGICIYILTSLVLVYFPQLLHKKKCLGFSPQLTAHRGGAGERIENTLAAFHWAVDECHADMLELDVHLTKDKQIVVLHDASLLRVAGVDANVGDFNYSDLPSLNQKLPVTFSDCCCKTLCDDTRIPLFTEVLEAFPNTPINIDLKQGSDELIVKTASLIHQYKREEITLWGSVTSQVLERCYQHDPSIPLYVSKQRVFFYPLLFWTGLLAFLPIREAAYEVALPSIYLGRQFKNSPLKQKLGPLLTRLIELYILHPTYVSYLRRRGVPTIVWVLNSDTDYKRAFRLGSEGVHTDFPSGLRAFISSNPVLCSQKKS